MSEGKYAVAENTLPALPDYRLHVANGESPQKRAAREALLTGRFCETPPAEVLNLDVSSCIQIRVRIEGIKSEGDLMVVMYSRRWQEPVWTLLGRTDVIRHEFSERNPRAEYVFNRSVEDDFSITEKRTVRLELFLIQQDINAVIQNGTSLVCTEPSHTVETGKKVGVGERAQATGPVTRCHGIEGLVVPITYRGYDEHVPLESFEISSWLGYSEMNLSEAVAARSWDEGWLMKNLVTAELGLGLSAARPKQTEKSVTELGIQINELDKAKEAISFDFLGSSLANTDAFATTCNKVLKPLVFYAPTRFDKVCNPYVILYRGPPQTGGVSSPGQEGFVPIYRTEVARRTNQPRFECKEIPIVKICGNDDQRDILIEVWDWQRTRAHRFIGECLFSFADVRTAFSQSKPLPLQLRNSYGVFKDQCNLDKAAAGLSRSFWKKRIVDPDRPLRQRYDDKEGKWAGTMQLQKIGIARAKTFLDYVRGGLEVGIIVGIDFTRSNRSAEDPSSLHYQYGPEANDYEQAINAVFGVLEHYDPVGRFPCYGFGAKLPPTHTVCSHCFALSGDYFDPELDGHVGVVKAYKRCAQNVRFHGPTEVKDIIRLAADFAAPYADATAKGENGVDMRYYVLLIITDGVVSDMQETINEVVRAGQYPISIIIVGVGDEDFTCMNELDADTNALYSTETKTTMTRDIVSFVPFNELRTQPDRLAYEILAELPPQVCKYFQGRGVDPRGIMQFESAGNDMGMEGITGTATATAQLNAMTVSRRAPAATGKSKSSLKQPVQAKKSETALMPNASRITKTTPAKEKEEKTGYIRKRLDRARRANVLPQFVLDQKAKLIRKAMSLGYTQKDIELVLMKGVPACNLEVLVDALTNSGPNSPYTATLRETANEGEQDKVLSYADEAMKLNLALPGQVDHSAVLDSSMIKASMSKVKLAANTEDGMCQVCFERKVDIKMIPCGHEIACERCSKKIGKVCPLCREPIKAFARC